MAQLGAAQATPKAVAPLVAASHACRCTHRTRRQTSAALSRSAAATIARPSPTAPLTARLQRHDRLPSLRVCASATGSLTAAPSEPPFKWGANMKNLGISVASGVLVWFLPPPSGVTMQAWHLLAIFLATIVGIITQPLPLGAVAMLGLGATMLTKTLTFAAAFSAFASEIP